MIIKTFRQITQDAIRLGFFLTCVIAPMWLKFPNAPHPFAYNYVTGFWICVLLLWTVGWWALSGFSGLKSVVRDDTRLLWAFLLLGLVLWTFASQNWAYMRESRPEIALSPAIQTALIILFAIAVACNPVPIRWLVALLVILMLFHASIGAVQVAKQSSIRHFFTALGEFELDPARSGTSVILSEKIRWLRPYGLMSHPNIYAGFLVIGLFASGAWITDVNRRLRWAGTLIFWFGLWVLLLTFSRGAWLGFGTGAVLFLILLWRSKLKDKFIWRQVLIAVVGAVFLAMAFFILYRPFLLARAGVGGEHTEERSVNERRAFIEIAEIITRKYPLLGVGSGNYAWFASYYIFYETDWDMRGDNVHNIYLMVQTELGVVGSLMFGLSIIIGIAAALRHSSDPYHAVLLCAVIALMVIGIFDHYPATVVGIQVMFWGLLAASGSRDYLSEYNRHRLTHYIQQPGD